MWRMGHKLSLSFATLVCTILLIVRVVSGGCTPEAARPSFLPLVAEGAPCATGKNSAPGCERVPQDVYDCCGVNSTMLDCLSKTCCSDSSLGEIGEDEVAEEPGAFEDCWMSEERGCDLSYLRNTSQSRSSWIVYPPDLTCYDGEPYGFQVFPGPSNGRLLVWLQGGGGCTNYETCEVPDTSTAITSLFPNTKGLFDMSRGADNPVISGGWTVVVVNYCSGDSHVGNATAELVSWDGASSANVTFSGARHVDRVLEWVAAQDFGTGPSARRLAGGCSAGSLGVQSWMYALRQRVGVTGFLFDSYVGILPPDLGAALLRCSGRRSGSSGASRGRRTRSRSSRWTRWPALTAGNRSTLAGTTTSCSGAITPLSRPAMPRTRRPTCGPPGSSTASSQGSSRRSSRATKTCPSGSAASSSLGRTTALSRLQSSTTRRSARGTATRPLSRS
uniref:Pectin acetylesterase n=1 Tax=Tetraselmis sp. GSL018 TaxID=582737 RepID=A0A061RMN9_9CHLO